MPELNGFEVAERLRAKYPWHVLPVIMLSASHHEDDIVTGLQAGCNGT